MVDSRRLVGSATFPVRERVAAATAFSVNGPVDLLRGRHGEAGLQVVGLLDLEGVLNIANDGHSQPRRTSQDMKKVDTRR
jgi:hypothetical protein